MATQCGIYTRLSVEDVQDLATARQSEDAFAFAARKGWEVAETYHDSGTSGWSGVARAEFERMLQDVEARRFEVLIVWRFDRLTRNLKDYARFWDAAQSAGVRLIGVADGVDTSTPTGELHATIMFGVARQESSNISTRAKRKLEQNAQQGKSVGGRSYGYAAGSREVVAEEAAWVRELFRRYATGDSLNEIHQDFIARGFRGTRSGHPTITSLRRMLGNPMYIGKMRFKGEIVAEGDWEPLVDQRTWDRVQAHLAVTRRPGRPQSRKYLLTGVIVCGQCERPMSGQGSEDPKGRFRPQYRCNRTVVGACGRTTLTAPPAEAWVAACTLAELASPTIRRALSAEAGRGPVLSVTEIWDGGVTSVQDLIGV